MTHRFWLTLLILGVWLMPLGPVPTAGAQNPGGRGALPPAALSGGGIVSNCTEGGLDANLAVGGTVTFNCGGPFTFFLTSTKNITQSTTVDGSGGITLDGSGSYSIFSVQPGVTLTLKNITLNGANGTNTDGGAIKNHGTLSLDHTIIQSSRTDSNHSGGAIFSDGPVFIVDSLLQNNKAGSAGALFANFAQAVVTISDSTFSGNVTSNTVTGFGGAIWVGEQAQVSITGGAILSNSAKFGGGLYLSQNATVTLASTGAPLLVSGNSATGSGGGIDNSAGRVTATNATLSRNSAPLGGGVYNNGGQLALTNATLSGNSAGSGGAIANDQLTGAASLLHVTLSGNTATFGGGGLYNNHASATLANVILSGNVVSNTFSSATYGGGIENYGTLTVTNSTISGNTARSNLIGLTFGGGLYNNAYTSHDTAVLINSTVSGNSAYDGGGILNVGTLALTNSTLNANSAAGTGGGLENYHGTALLTNVTLSGNSANTGGGLFQQGTAPTESTTLRNSLIVSGLSGANCYEDPGSFGSLVSAGYNLSNEGTCTPYFNQPGDVNNQNPNLGPVANNGGPTLTQLPIPPSPAIDAIPFGTNGCGTLLTTDQRGAPRPINGLCDRGAVEAAWPFPRLWLALVRR
jgi:predicted outer membrane repeat protein